MRKASLLVPGLWMRRPWSRSSPGIFRYRAGMSRIRHEAPLLKIRGTGVLPPRQRWSTNGAIRFAMASPELSSNGSTASCIEVCQRLLAINRVAAVLVILGLAIPPLDLWARPGEQNAPPLPGVSFWNPNAATQPDPFAWPPPSLPPAPYLLRGKNFQFRSFPGFVGANDQNILPRRPAASEEEPWTPADLMPIPPPDGMPVAGTPAGLAMMENAIGNGIITGEVSDATTLNPIAGAFVEIAGSGKTAETDAQGRFQFNGIAAGTYNIEASQLGYFSDTTVITVIEGSPSEVRFGLKIKPTDDSANVFTLDEETVVGEYQGDSQGDLFLDLKVDRTLNTGLTAEDFAKAPVSDAGEAVEKVSGANIVDGKFAVVRGLADRYVSTTYNGASISSAVPSRKAVRLDLFPTSVLSGIDVDKIYSPALLGDFGGAAINIRTKYFPDEPIVQFKLKQEYNPSLPDKMLLSADNDLEYFGKLGEDINFNRSRTRTDS